MRRLITNSFQLFLTDHYLFHHQIWLSRYLLVVQCYCQGIIFIVNIVNKLSFYWMRRLITNSFHLFLTDQYPFHHQIWLSRYILVVQCYCQGIIFIVNIVNKLSFYWIRRLITISFHPFLTGQIPFHR